MWTASPLKGPEGSAFCGEIRWVCMCVRIRVSVLCESRRTAGDRHEVHVQSAARAKPHDGAIEHYR